MTKKVNDLLDLVNGLDCKNAVIQLVSEDQSRSNDFHLKEVLQMMTKKQCEQFWGPIYQMLERVENEDDLSVDPSIQMQFAEKDLTFIEAIQHIVTEMLDGDIVWCESVYSTLSFIHNRFFLLPEQYQEGFCRVFEQMWTKERDFRERYIPNMCQYLMHQALQLTKQFSGYMKRLNAIREGFKLIDFSNSQSDVLKAFIIESFSISNFVMNPNGKRLLSLFFVLTPSFPRECFRSLQTCLLELSNSVVRTWGEIIISSDLGCEDEETRDVLEKEVIQEIMRIAIHAANQRVFVTTKTILATFVHCRNHKELWTRLTELYEPLLFRSLSATSSLVRRHAVIIFTDCFPLGTSETRDSYSIEEQFKALLILCDDECPSVRSVAVAGVLHLLRNYYELLPVSVTTVILDHFTQHIIYDQRSEVREFCFKGVIDLLENRLVYSVLFPRIMKLWCFIYDKNVRIRRLFLQMLIKLQNIKSFDMSKFFCVGDFLNMLLYDYYTSPANSINKLYLKYLFPLFWKETNEYKFVTRVHNFLLSNPDACYVFFKECIHSADVNDSVKLILVLLKSLFLCYEGETKEEPVKPVKKATKKKGKGRKRDAAEISTEESRDDSLENGMIPTNSTSFQKNLFHLIVLMMKSLQLACTEEELDNSYAYMTEIISSDRLLNLHSHCIESQSEDDFLLFLSYFDYSVIDSIRPNFVMVILSSSQNYLSNHLPLFMQLVYHWNIGNQIVDSALEQIRYALTHPEEVFDSEDEQLVTVTMPIKKQKTTKSKKKSSTTPSEVQLSLLQSVALLKAIVNDSISSSSSYSPTVLEHIHSVLEEVLPQFQEFIYPPSTSFYERRSQLATDFFYELIGIVLKEDLYETGKESLQDSKERSENFDKADMSTPRDQDDLPSLVGSLPSSMVSLLEILRNTTFNLNDTGSYYLSLLNLLLLYSQKATSLLLWDEQYVNRFFIVLRGTLTTLFSSSMEPPKTRKKKGKVYEEEDQTERMKSYTIQNLFPAFGKWLKQIHTLCGTTPGCNADFPGSLLYDVINTFPRTCFQYCENELIPLVKSYPSQLETHLDVLIQKLIMNNNDNRDYPSIENLQSIYQKRKEPESMFALSLFCKNYQIMKLIADYLHSHLTSNNLLEVFAVLSIMMNCIEIRSSCKLKIPATIYSPIVKFIDNFDEKYRQTLTSTDSSEAKRSLEYIKMIASDIISLAKQNGKLGVGSKLNVIEEEAEYVQEEQRMTEKKSEEVLFKGLEEEDSIPLEEESLEDIEDKETKEMISEKVESEDEIPKLFHEEKDNEEVVPEEVLTEDDEKKVLEEPHEEKISEEISEEPSCPPQIEEEAIDDSPNEQSLIKVHTTIPSVPAIHKEEETKTVEEKNQSFSDSYFDEPEY